MPWAEHHKCSRGTSQTQPPGHDDPFDEVKEHLRGQRQYRRGDGTFEDEREVVAPDSGEDRLPVTAGADERAERREADVHHHRGLDAGENRRRGERHLDPSQLRPRREPEGFGRLAERRTDAGERGMGVPHDRQQATSLKYS